MLLAPRRFFKTGTGIYYWYRLPWVPMKTKLTSNAKSAEARLFRNGRSQAVRLPKEFRFEGDRVHVRRMGAGVLLEPIPEKRKETVEEWFARIDALRGDATLELASLDLRIAVNAVGEIVGKTATEDLLDSIFSQFCIGK